MLSVLFNYSFKQITLSNWHEHNREFRRRKIHVLKKLLLLLSLSLNVQLKSSSFCLHTKTWTFHRHRLFSATRTEARSTAWIWGCSCHYSWSPEWRTDTFSYDWCCQEEGLGVSGPALWERMDCCLFHVCYFYCFCLKNTQYRLL